MALVARIDMISKLYTKLRKFRPNIVIIIIIIAHEAEGYLVKIDMSWYRFSPYMYLLP